MIGSSNLSVVVSHQFVFVLKLQTMVHCTVSTQHPGSQLQCTAVAWHWGCCVSLERHGCNKLEATCDQKWPL